MMPKSQPSTDSLSAARALLEESGLEAARQERDRPEANHKPLHERLQRLTAEEAAARRKAAGESLGDLEALIAREESGVSLRDELAEVQAAILANARNVKAARERYNAIISEVEPRVRVALLDGHTDLVGEIFTTLIRLAGMYRGLASYEAAAEHITNANQLRGLAFEIPFIGVRNRLVATDDVQPSALAELGEDFARRGLLPRDVAATVIAYARNERADLEQQRQRRAEREAAAQKQNRIDALAWRRQALLDSRLEIIGPNGYPLPPAEAVARFDRQNAGLPIPRPAVVPAIGELVG